MAIIELGDVSAPEFAEEPLVPASSRHRFGFVRPIAAALAVICALALTGSGQPSPPSVTESWSAEIGLETWPYVFGDIVLVSSGTPGTTPDIAAYDVVTGRVLWTGHDDQITQWLNPDPDSQQLYAPATVRQVVLPDGNMVFGLDTRAVDAHTGRTLWQRSGNELAATADQVLLGDRDDQGRVTGLHLVRAADGTSIWDRAIAVTDNLVVSEGPAETARIVAKSETGELSTLRWSDGVTLARRQGSRPDGTLGWGPQVLGDQFYDVRTDAPDTTVIAYRTDTLTELWRYQDTGEVYVQDCGPVLCVNDIHLTNGVDPATGVRKWKLPSGNVTPLDHGRLLFGGSRDMATESSVVDAVTGRTIGTAPHGTQAVALDDGRLFALGDTRTAPYRVTISRWDPVTGRSELIGAVPGRSDTCQAHGQRLICTSSGRLGVTDVG
ncbi:hypothetical protein [Actinoplanes sp. HUAS TT8]|uniref:hypothetical protein n=1 Tax=Actinoplanes sp. HUAS TT8 TaxID=3447453 RepID=UPI003F51EAB0